MANRILSQLSNGKKGLDNLLAGRGDWRIKEISIIRRPLPETLKQISNVINKKQHDNIYHLYQQILLQDPKSGREERINIEKNETVNILRNVGMIEPPEDRRAVDLLGKEIKLTDYIMNAQKASIRAGKHYFNYQLRGNNCQDWTVLHLRGNKLGNALENKKSIEFIHQNSEQLIPNWLGKITEFLSTAARKLGEVTGVSA